MAQKSKNNNKMNMNMPRPSMLWIYGLIGLFIIGWYLFDGSNEAPLPSDWTTVQEMVEKGDVEKIQVVNRDQAQVFLKKEAGEKYRNDQVDKRFRRLPESGVQLTFTIGSVDSFREDLKAAEEKSGQTVPVIYENKANDWTSILINLLPWVVIIGAWFFIMRSMSRGAGAGGGGGIMNVGKAKAQVFDKDNSKRVTFKDVAGLEEAKVEIMEIVDFLKKADKYKELGAKIPKGALLVGPPGTGKTLLAKAVAGEANVPFLSISGSDFVEMFVGVGASRVRDLFEQICRRNSYQKYPLVSLLFAVATPFWLILFACAKLISGRRARMLPAALGALGVWLSYLFGPCTLPRYALPLFCLAPALLILSFLPPYCERSSGLCTF